jgi:hypothetical protein
VTFEVLSGVKVRREGNAVALAHAISTQDPPSLRAAWPEAPRGLDRVLQRAMARDPRQRPRSAGELVARLRAAIEPDDTAGLRTERISAPPVRAAHPPAKAASTARSHRRPTHAASSPGSVAGDPVSAVKSFYTLAAAHRYAAAWGLADPAMHSQLGGYRSFQSGQAGDRSITFTSARTVSQTPSNARVMITTTSVRTNGTQHCVGTVDLESGAQAGHWQLHQIAINCS